MRLIALLVVFVAAWVIVAAGAVRDSLVLVAVGLSLAVPAGLAMKPELGKERYAAAISGGLTYAHRLGQLLLRRGPMAAVGGAAGLLVAALLYWNEGLPLQCQDLFFPDPSICGILSRVGDWLPPLLMLVGLLIGWYSRGRSNSAVKTTARTAFEVVGQLVALAVLVHGARIVAPIATNLPGYRRPWVGLAIAITVSIGIVLYLVGLRRWTGRRAVTARTVGWLLFTAILLLPRGLRGGALLSALALPAVPTWRNTRSAGLQHISVLSD